MGKGGKICSTVVLQVEFVGSGVVPVGDDERARIHVGIRGEPGGFSLVLQVEYLLQSEGDVLRLNAIDYRVSVFD